MIEPGSRVALTSDILSRRISAPRTDATVSVSSAPTCSGHAIRYHHPGHHTLNVTTSETHHTLHVTTRPARDHTRDVTSVVRNKRVSGSIQTHPSSPNTRLSTRTMSQRLFRPDLPGTAQTPRHHTGHHTGYAITTRDTWCSVRQAIGGHHPGHHMRRHHL
jgi:hypothetical protein